MEQKRHGNGNKVVTNPYGRVWFAWRHSLQVADQGDCWSTAIHLTDCLAHTPLCDCPWTCSFTFKQEKGAWFSHSRVLSIVV